MQIGTAERNETSIPNRVQIDGVDYEVVKESWYGPELTIGVRPLRA